MKILAQIYKNSVDLRTIDNGFISSYVNAILKNKVDEIYIFPGTNEFILALDNGSFIYADLIQRGD